jgi:chromosome segregation ATPase
MFSFSFYSSFCSECADLVTKCAEWDVDIRFHREKSYDNEDRIAGFRALIADRQVVCDQAKAVLEDLKERVRESRALVENLWDRCEELSVRCVKLVDLERDVDEIREKIESARVIVDAGTERLDRRTDVLEQAKERIVHLENNAGIQDAKIRDLEQRIENAKNRMNALREKLEEKTRIADVLGSELN